MIAALIHSAIANRFLVLLLTGMLTVAGLWALRTTPVDALPDLSDVQVIIKTSYPGQAPQVVEDQVTYPLTTTMLSVPGAVTVRGYSFFGDSFVYVLFEDGTDLYWARSRVLEYLSQVQGRLPAAARPTLGPDATGVGWVYEYALVDRSGGHDLSQLRSLQDWFLKFELQSVPGVAEVATAGGMVRQYQVVVDPNRLRAYGLPLARIRQAIQQANQEVGGSVIEMAEAEYMVRATGYLNGIEDLRRVPLGPNANGTPVLLEDVAEIRTGPQLRRGIVDLDGEGEVVGGVVVMRSGGNALRTIEAVKARLRQLQGSLPKGVEIITTYDRSALIERAIDTLQHKLVGELIVVVLVCALFLGHLRSALVLLIFLPIGILTAFLVMRLQGIDANIMSLGGIAIAIGAMVDAAIVMIENLHRHLERRPGLRGAERWALVARATAEVGPALFFSLLIVTLSFLPVFTLEAQEGRLFAPLAYTKTYAMAAAAGLSVTLVPVLMGLLVRGQIPAAQRNPLNRALSALYRPLIGLVLRAPRRILLAGLFAAASMAWPLLGLWPLPERLGAEFMPELDEGDLMYMPTTFPALSIGKAQELLQQTDRLIKTVPEVARVFGKIGRAETATDPAPLTMIETLIQFRPREQWRAGMTPERLRQELDQRLQLPGVSNAWVMPIRTRIDMLATGVKTPVGVRITGPDLARIQDLGAEVERLLGDIPGTASAFAERVVGGRYLMIDIDRAAAARFGLNIADVQEIVRTAVGGMNVTETIEGRERYPVNLRYPRELRDSPQRLRDLPIVTASGQTLRLADVARVQVADGPGLIKSENARPNGWVFVDIQGRDLAGYVAEASARVARELQLPPGYALSWAGQYQYLERAQQRLALVVPVTLGIIVLLLYLSFRRLGEVLLIIATLPLALVGGLWLLWSLDFALSVAVGVGFIALAGVAVELGVVMLVYLNQALQAQREQAATQGRALHQGDLHEAVIEGAVQRLRPILMTVATIVIGLLPILLGSGTGAEVMQRIAAPMVGGMLSATLLTLLVLPAAFLLWQGRRLPASPPPQD